LTFDGFIHTIGTETLSYNVSLNPALVSLILKLLLLLKTTSDMNVFNCTLRSLERPSVKAVVLRRHSLALGPAVAVLSYHPFRKSTRARIYDRYLG
jgi:hypothetical protein